MTRWMERGVLVAGLILALGPRAGAAPATSVAIKNGGAQLKQALEQLPLPDLPDLAVAGVPLG
jgi:hypothetical protein